MAGEGRDPTPTIYTVGHGRDSFEDLVTRCEAHGVRIIADVRSQPYSRHAPDFVKARLEMLCAERGLGYRWLGATLGGRPRDRAVLDEDGAPDHELMGRSARFEAGLTELEGLVDTGVVALLCAETDPWGCHRTRLIAPALISRGARVLHIVPGGAALAHQPSLGL